jgi:NAD(P)H-dependent flavin oxidoreductase YrpB (nitropropane dioxygenase family)
MLISTRLTEQLGLKHPIMLAPMDLINDGRGLAAALVLGAEGVLLGTRLYANREAAAPPDATKRVLRAAENGTALNGVTYLTNVGPLQMQPLPYCISSNAFALKTSSA